MEFVKINEKAIKITLSSSEAQSLEIDSDIAFDPEKSKLIFREMLTEAKKEIGFQYAGERIVAEVFDSRDGGCEIFISCLSGDEIMYKDKGEEALLSKLKLQNSIFCFDNIDSLLKGCFLLFKAKCKKNTSVYYDPEKEKYYILLEDVSKKDIKYGFLYELSKRVKSSRSDYLKERCTLICEGNAHEVLGKLR